MLAENNILKLEDELAVQETKVVWKWEKKKLPPCTQSLITEKIDNLRGRRFETLRNLKANSIHTRLAKRAGSEVGSLTSVKSKKTVVLGSKKKIIDEKYKYICRNRTCYICRE